MEGPSSFVFYVVARVGPQGQYYSLAVASREDNRAWGFHGIDVVNACLAVSRLLGSDENRAAIEAELALAKEFYSAEEHPVETERVLPESETWYSDFIEATQPAGQPHPRLAGDGRHRNLLKPVPFPFVSTCLMLGLGYDVKSRTAHPSIVCEPLGLLLGADLDKHGIVVLDVTTPKDVRYGIVAYEKTDQPRNATDPIFDFHDGYYSDDETVKLYPKEVETYSRRLLDARQYMLKFYYIPTTKFQGQVPNLRDAEARVAGAQAVWRTVAAEALNDIWPPIRRNPGLGGGRSYTERSRELPLGEAARSLVDEIWNQEEYLDADLKLLEQPEVKGSLRQFLESRPKQLGQSPAAGQLLAVAYGGFTSLNWATFTHTSYKAVARALREPCMQSVRSISLSIDEFPTTDLPALLEALLELPWLSHVCLMQSPARLSEDIGTSTFIQLAHSPQYLPLMQRVSFVSSSLFSSALRGIPWLPLLGKDGVSHYEAFPVGAMYIRKPVQAPELPWPERNMRMDELDREADPHPEFHTTCFPLTDGLLVPERFVTGFLSFLGTRCEDDLLFSFAQATASLRHMPRQRMGLFPAENLSIPEQQHSKYKGVSEQQNKLPHPMPARAWVVLVSCEGPPRGSHSAPFIRYAFAQAKRTLFDNSAHKGITLDDVKICGLQGFLEATGVAFDAQVLRKRLNEATSSVHEKIRMAQRRDRGTPREEWISEMDESSARQLLVEVTST
ncbi:hypothetical protein NLG97_g10135 [Lecanicillium saksenae]|uniref:Uncharacterized protein n=1 Tax=Lecanicillium saksenae TaxID=468837 RepID=A0ACC1QG19_9HYPO|nr:hypothetical protein NLG97_g10135 [Lecanicillium saksenae]